MAKDSLVLGPLSRPSSRLPPAGKVPCTTPLSRSSSFPSGSFSRRTTIFFSTPSFVTLLIETHHHPGAAPSSPFNSVFGREGLKLPSLA
ncbi:hypothetical protein BT93_I0387 [Corymbia citriodora subsp. variegata]|nr:hypothetical protein BT93_I0387 [Corymbia citriodora subsp. variegata]KAF8012237.1 hypothetical protein BT93_I0387 [Corymbia citriodora subsp. variegata]